MESLARAFRLLGYACSLAGCARPADAPRIEEAIARFSDASSRRDFAAMSAAFTRDAVWEASADELSFRQQGSAAIERALGDSTRKFTLLFQQVSPPTIASLEPAHASTRTSITELLRDESRGVVMHLSGVYHDELVEQDGRWLFKHRRFELKHRVDVGERHG